MNRRNFFTWIAAGIGWAKLGKVVPAKTTDYDFVQTWGPNDLPRTFTKEWKGRHGDPSAVSDWNKLNLETRSLIAQVYIPTEYLADSVITWSLKDLE